MTKKSNDDPQRVLRCGFHFLGDTHWGVNDILIGNSNVNLMKFSNGVFFCVDGIEQHVMVELDLMGYDMTN